MDADDISMSERLKEEKEHLNEHPEAIVAGFEIIDDTGNLISINKVKLTLEVIYYGLPFYDCLAHSTLMFRK